MDHCVRAAVLLMRLFVVVTVLKSALCFYSILGLHVYDHTSFNRLNRIWCCIDSFGRLTETYRFRASLQMEHAKLGLPELPVQTRT